MTSNTLTWRSHNYNWDFHPDTEEFSRWGVTEDDNPTSSLVGPEHLDIEVSTICHGINGKLCDHCYTRNSPDGVNMSFDTFKALFEMVRSNLTTIHFNVGDIDANPDLNQMMRYAVENDVTPSVTISGTHKDEQSLYNAVMYCGHIDVSAYDIPKCMDTIQELTLMGCHNVNMRLLLSNETFSQCSTSLHAVNVDRRTDKLNSIKIGLLRPQNRAKGFTQGNDAQLKQLLNTIAMKKIPFGVCPCLGRQVQQLMGTTYKDLQKLALDTEPCEAGLFSGYINVKGVFYPCPFLEFENVDGVPVLDKDNFVSQVWNSPEVKEWREQLLTINRSCPMFV